MTPEQMRQRIAELEEALKPMSDAWNKLQTDGGLNDPERPSHGTGTIKQKHLRRAASLLSASPPASEPDADVVERVEFNDEQLLAHFYWRCDPHGPEPNTLALEIWEVLRNNINHPNVMTALSAMRPAIDREKLAEIRERHDSVANMADDEWDNRIYTIADDAFSDRAALLEMIGGGSENPPTHEKA